MNPPRDDDVAPVIPLRQRQGDSAPTAVRQPLPRERAAFDPELEPTDVTLRRRSHRRLVAHLSVHASRRPRLRVPAPRVAAVLVPAVVLAATGWLVLQSSGTRSRNVKLRAAALVIPPARSRGHTPGSQRPREARPEPGDAQQLRAPA